MLKPDPAAQESRHANMRSGAHTLPDAIERWWSYIALAGVSAILLGAAIVIALTAPPRTITMATGSPGGAYHEFGLRYREILAQDGVDLKLLPTGGAIENLEKLRDTRSQVSVGFIQSGTTSHLAAPEIESLGTVFHEPLWTFTRLSDQSVQALNHTRISIGPPGSASRKLGLELLRLVKVEAELFELTPQIAAEQLIAGEIDTAFIVASWDAPAVQLLVKTEGIAVRGFPRAEAITRLLPFMEKLVLPAGVLDLAGNRPPADVTIISPKASLAVRADLHPGIQYLLLNAATKIHSGTGMFQKVGQFPAAEGIDIPLSEEAQRFYKSGRPFLYNHLPFWIATVGARLLVIIIPLALLLYPFVKFVPELYDWAMKSKVTKLYNEMMLVEERVKTRMMPEEVNELVAKLDQLDQRAHHLRIPTSYASMIYMLRTHIDLVRERIMTSRQSA